MKPTTIRQRLLSYRQQMMTSVCALIGIAESDYKALVFEKGIQYAMELDKYDQLSKSKVYWQWWNITWAQLDHEWIEWQLEGYKVSERGVDDGGKSRHELWIQYMRYHNVEDMVQELPPPPKMCFHNRV